MINERNQELNQLKEVVADKIGKSSIFKAYSLALSRMFVDLSLSLSLSLSLPSQ
jgi:hypothetical protein